LPPEETNAILMDNVNQEIKRHGVPFPAHTVNSTMQVAAIRLRSPPPSATRHIAD
jgi:hypothetical protein